MKLKATLVETTNPIAYEGNDLTNRITKVVMPATVKNSICNRIQNGLEAYHEFCEKKISSNSLSIWDPMKKFNLPNWKDALETVKCKIGAEANEG